MDVLILQRLAAAPHTPQNTAQVKTVLEEAKDSGNRLDPHVIEDTGKQFIDAATTNPDAWQAALAFLNYRSSLITYTRTVKTVSVPEGSATVYEMIPVDSKPLPQLSHIPTAVSPDDSARFEIIGRNLKQKLPFGSPELWLTGGAVSLDNRYVRHVVFIGVEVHYTGRRLILQDALFINCTFIFENTQLGRQLGQVLLASSPVNFETAG